MDHGVKPGGDEDVVLSAARASSPPQSRINAANLDG
jgi:hypothetical protein